MKKRSVFLVTLVILLALGMAVVSCGDGSSEADPLKGTWVCDNDQLTLSNGDSFEFSTNGNKVLKGTYTTANKTDNTSIYLKPTHLWAGGSGLGFDPDWYNKTELNAMGYKTGDLTTLFSTWTGTVNGNRLTVKWQGTPEIFTKK